MESPIGRLMLAASPEGLRAIRFVDGPAAPEPGWVYDAAACEDARSQLSAYFDGSRRSFDLPLDPQGTPFQLAVWEALQAIPFGATITYAELAARLGNPAAIRAVGAANGRNPLPIVVPCHRVIGSDGSLTGYAGGLARKAALLAHEGVPVSPPVVQGALF